MYAHVRPAGLDGGVVVHHLAHGEGDAADDEVREELDDLVARKGGGTWGKSDRIVLFEFSSNARNLELVIGKGDESWEFRTEGQLGLIFIKRT